MEEENGKNIYDHCALIFCYSFIGWLWETIYCSIKAKHFVYRGFLLGPITPIYGFGVVGVLYFIEPYQQNIVLLFFLSADSRDRLGISDQLFIRENFSSDIMGL